MASKYPPVAIVGVSALFPGSITVGSFWNNIMEGKDLLSDIPDSHFLLDDYYDADPTTPDKTYAKRGGFIPDVPFAPMDFGVPPNIIPATDTAQLLALNVAQSVLRDAVGDFENMDRDRVSCVLGVASATELVGHMSGRLQQPVWERALRNIGLNEEQVDAFSEEIRASYTPWQESTFPGLLGNVVAGRIANRLDLGGTNVVVDAACGSSLAAVEIALNELYLGQSDLVISGGVDTLNDILMFMCFSKTPALSPSGDCRPFSDAADGTMLGEGIGMVALKRLADAEQDGDQIYGVIKGLGTSSDGRSKSIYAPVSTGQAKALRRAYAYAGYSPETVELVEAHGTGTKAGDKAEFGGLEMVFCDETETAANQWCALGTVKSQIGHTKAAAGSAGLVKIVMALHHKVIPPTIKVDRPHQDIDFEKSPFYLNTEARPWIRSSDHPRRASVSAFGFGGTNFHCAVEEYRGNQKARFRTLPCELFVWSSATPADLRTALSQTIDDENFLFAAHDAQKTFDATLPSRVAIVASSADDLKKKIDQVTSHLANNPNVAISMPNGVHYATGSVSGDVGFLFPGQGSQYVNMGADLAMFYDAAREVWDASADLTFDGRSIHELVFPLPAFDDDARDAQQVALTKTEWAQPAIGTASLATLEMMRALGVTPVAVGGHSYGEITSLHAAGVFDRDATWRVSRKRGELMAAASEKDGSMTAVVSDVDTLTSKLAAWKIDVVVANHNAPTQVVVSGATDQIEAFEQKLENEGMKFKRLPVATAFHSAIVADSSGPFSDFLQAIDFTAPSIPVYANSTAAPYGDSSGDQRETLAAQIGKPVRFVEQIEAMYDAGVRTFVEVGPDAVLSNLVQKILDSDDVHTIATDRRGKRGIESFFNAVAQMTVAGLAVDFAALWTGYAEPIDPQTIKKPAMTVELGGANYQKPSPYREPTERAKQVAADLNRPSPAPTATPVATPTVVATQNEAIDRSALERLQRETARVQSEYQRMMADSHATFLQMAESSLHGLMNGVPATNVTRPIAAQLPAPMPAAAPVPQFAPVEPTAPVTPAIVRAPTQPTPPVVAAAPAVDLTNLMLVVVAEKTGYPTEMLELSMELEADLGIDSIKRVEILSAMQEKVPTLPEVETSKMAALVTLQEIVDYMQSLMPDEPAAPLASAPPAAPSVDLTGLMLDVVAEKTGYPSQMLELSMELESDLGIDSIKRVEILSAMQDKVPSLPEVETSKMAALVTLQEIVDYMSSLMGDSASAGAATPVQTPTVDLTGLMLDVVAEKTGYPAQMLDLSMELESDLGIDSIKRVEILSAMQDKVPTLPEVETSKMAALVTLQEIVDYMSSLMGGAPATTTAKAETEKVIETPVVKQPIRRYVVQKVDAPKRGLAMFGLSDVTNATVVTPDVEIGAAFQAALSEHGIATSHAQSAAEVAPETSCVIYLSSLESQTSLESATALQRDAFEVALKIAPQFETEGGVFVTVQNTGGDFGRSHDLGEHAFLAGLPGLVKSAHKEWNKASVRAIDLGFVSLRNASRLSPTAIAQTVLDEMWHGGLEVEVGIDLNGNRSTFAAIETKVDAINTPLTKDDVIVVSGGGRGVTAASIVELGRQTKASFVLLGRTALEDEPAAFVGKTSDAELKSVALEEAKNRGEKITPKDLNRTVSRIRAMREIRSTLADLDAFGCRARYVASDVRDRQQLGDALDQVRAEWGPITGLVHGAGVIADQALSKKTIDQFDFVFETKVDGLQSLLEVTADDPLKTICMFSSVAARTGNPGQSDYAAANEVLNRIAWREQKRRPECVVKSIGWGPWESGMVTPELAKLFAQRGIALIGLSEGASAFVEDVQSLSPDAVEVVIGGGVNAGGLNQLVSGGVAQAELQIGEESQPYLGDHTIKGRVVVPVVMAMEWMARESVSSNPASQIEAISGLRVLNGLTFDDFAESQQLTTRAEADQAGLQVELRDDRGLTRYAAHVAFASTQPKELPFHGLNGDQPKYEIASNEFYTDDALFHGPKFRCLRSVDHMSENGARATLHGVIDADWQDESWVTDPLLLDGCLQLALLWGLQVVGEQTLPMCIETIVPYRAPQSGELHCELVARDVSAKRTLTDMRVTDSQGNVVCDLRGVEMYIVPTGTAN